VHWVTEPVFCHKNHYISYGNERTSSCKYVGVAVVVKIPPANKRT
jgi:hypothetical protein